MPTDSDKKSAAEERWCVEKSGSFPLVMQKQQTTINTQSNTSVGYMHGSIGNRTKLL